MPCNRHYNPEGTRYFHLLLVICTLEHACKCIWYLVAACGASHNTVEVPGIRCDTLYQTPRAALTEANDLSIIDMTER